MSDNPFEFEQPQSPRPAAPRPAPGVPPSPPGPGAAPQPGFPPSAPARPAPAAQPFPQPGPAQQPAPPAARQAPSLAPNTPSTIRPQQPAPSSPAPAPLHIPIEAVEHPTPRPSASSRTSQTKALFDKITAEVRKIYVGQDELVLGTLVALFSGGHVLIESVPGLGKTLFVRTLGRVLGCQFGRIQFTADLMPSDITGAPVFDMKTQEFRFRPGPIFTQLLLADEINRSPAKTHAALLEIMQEYCVTIERTTHKIERPFLVLATQNPIESEGTYNLPEAQLDRFMLKMKVEYPSAEEENSILLMHSLHQDLDRRLTTDVHCVASPAEILAATQICDQVQVAPKLVNYINTIVRQTRSSPNFHLGASPRAGIALMQGARTLAAFYGRDYAVPDDVVSLVLPALRHRVILTPEAEVEGRAVDELLNELVRSVEVPRL